MFIVDDKTNTRRTSVNIIWFPLKLARTLFLKSVKEFVFSKALGFYEK